MYTNQSKIKIIIDFTSREYEQFAILNLVLKMVNIGLGRFMKLIC